MPTLASSGPRLRPKSMRTRSKTAAGGGKSAGVARTFFLKLNGLSIEMPYAILSAKGGFKVVNTATGKVHAAHTTREKAEAQVRLLRGVEHGMVPRGRPEMREEPRSRSPSDVAKRRRGRPKARPEDA